MRMKRQTIKLLLCFLLVNVVAFSQRKRLCAYETMDKEVLRQKAARMQEKINAFSAISSANKVETDEVETIRIPIVVHVIHNQRDGRIVSTNISKEQIQSQIDVLNEDFRKKENTIGFAVSDVGADMQLEFYLAISDPMGNPTDGIRRVYTQRTNFDVFDDAEELSDLSYWDSERYLNIWVAPLSSIYIGFGEFPTGDFDGLDTDEISKKNDGLIIDYQYFGRLVGAVNDPDYNLGRTTTHEVGHWLGLLHTWGDDFCGDDFCADTPTAESSNLEISCTPVFSFCDGRRTQNMIENYMDYSPDACMNTFTKEQKNRVRTILQISERRRRFLQNLKEDFSKVATISVEAFNHPSPLESTYFKVRIPEKETLNVTVFSTNGLLLQTTQFPDFTNAIVPLSHISNYKSPQIIHFSTSTQTTVKRIFTE